MKSKFEYLVDRDDNKKITGRSIQIAITDRTSDITILTFNSLEKMLNDEGYYFCGCPFITGWAYGDTIVIDDKEEADHIKKLYKAWKKAYKNQ